VKMSVYITGDTHGDFSRFSSKRFPDGKDLTKSDFVAIAGDFGGIWDLHFSKKQEQHWLNWLDEKPWTTLFLDGNHENFDRLYDYPQVEMFGGVVGKISDSIFHLRRGEVYEIDGRKFFVFGGGYSIDKVSRMPHVSWWPQEMPSFKEYKDGLDNLAKHNNGVDYILTHTCSSDAFHLMKEHHTMFHKEVEEERQIREYFKEIENNVDYKHWYCGHFHVSGTYNKTTFLDGNIKKIV